MEECERGEIDFIGSSRFTIEFSVFFFTMIRSSCSCHPLFRCGFLILSLMCRSFNLSIAFRQASSIFYSLFVKLLGGLNEKRNDSCLINVAPIFDVSSFRVYQMDYRLSLLASVVSISDM